ncbi:hypothetical protein ACT8ZV_09570 [Nocardioides sp. MAHUQ-72]|uniref:hypothetical protein n=1 Tax=unclassified Nocardioides TaxID=2615069 RepID=UPI00361C2173
MLFADLPRLLLRRWYAVLPGLVVCVLLGLYAKQSVQPTVQMTASVVMLPPTHTVGVGGNPYMALAGLESAADVVARRVVTPKLERELKDDGVESFTVVRDTGTAAPMLLITADGTDRAGVEQGIQALVDAVPGALLSLQQSAQVPDSDLITTQVVATPGQPLVSRSPQLRAVLVAVAAGLLMTLVLVVLLDLVVTRLQRRIRRDREPARPPQPQQRARLGSVSRRRPPGDRPGSDAPDDRDEIRRSRRASGARR